VHGREAQSVSLIHVAAKFVDQRAQCARIAQQSGCKEEGRTSRLKWATRPFRLFAAHPHKLRQRAAVVIVGHGSTDAHFQKALLRYNLAQLLARKMLLQGASPCI
jgi:hypothetical protein